jgi:hypothetical protein
MEQAVISSKGRTSYGGAVKIDIKALEKAEKEHVKRNRDWTDEEHKAVLRFYNKVPVLILAKQLCRSIHSIQCHYREKCRG